MTQIPGQGLGGFLARLLTGLAGSVQQGLATKQQQDRENDLLADKRARENELLRRKEVIDTLNMAVGRGVEPSTTVFPETLELPGGEQIPTTATPDAGQVLQKTLPQLRSETAENIREEQQLDAESQRALNQQREAMSQDARLVRIQEQARLKEERDKQKLELAILEDSMGEIPTTMISDGQGGFRQMTLEEIANSRYEQANLARDAEEARQVRLTNHKFDNQMDALEQKHVDAKDLAQVQNDLRKELETHKASLKKNATMMRKWGDMSNTLKERILRSATIKDVTKRIRLNWEKIKSTSGEARSRIDSAAKFLGWGEDAVYARALFAELKSAIFSRAGQAWTANEIAVMAPMVPEIGNIFSQNDNADQIDAKLKNIEEASEQIVVQALRLAQSEGKTFDTSVVNDFGWSEEVILNKSGLQRMRIQDFMSPAQGTQPSTPIVSPEDAEAAFEADMKRRGLR